MSESSSTATCPAGHDGAQRLLSVFASVGGGDAGPSGSVGEGPPAGPCGGSCACYPG